MFARSLLVSAITAATLINAVVVPMATAQAATESARKSWSIPAGSLEDALSAFAASAGTPLTFEPALVAGKRSNGLHGDYSVDEGFEQLLQGSGLQRMRAPNGTYTLKPVPTGAAVLPTMKISGEVNPNAALVYASDEVSSLGLRLSAQKTPATINTITPDFWAATGARTLDDVMSFVPGVNLTDNGGWTGDALIVRGFATTLPFRDGMRSVNSYGQSLRTMPDTIERVELVKGPAGAEFGVAEPGGAVNFISKKPQRETAGSTTVSAGEDGYRRIAVDITGGIAAQGNVQGRVISAYEEPPEWRDGRPDDTHRYTFAPSVRWVPSEDSDVLLSYERNYQNSPQDRGIIYLQGAWPGGFAPREWSYHQKSSTQTNETDRLTLSASHRIQQNTTLSAVYELQKYRYRLREFRNAETEPGWGDLYAEDGLSWSGVTTTALLWSDWAGDIDADSFRVTLEHILALGATTHTLSASIDDYGSRADNTFGDFTNTNTIDIFDTDNNQTPIITATGDSSSDVIKVDERGVSVRWMADWSDRFRTIVGVRRYDYDYRYEPKGDGTDYGSEKSSYRVAASYDLIPNHTIFAGISDGYKPQSGITRNGSSVDPTHDESLELGIKSSFADNRLLWTNSVFQIEREDISIADPDNEEIDGEMEDFVVNAGSARIRGFESELIGNIDDMLQLRAGAAWMDSEIIDNEEPEFEGNQFSNTPEQQFSLLASYRWGKFGLDDLSTDFGAIRIGERYGNSGNTLELPAYTLLNAGVTYRLAPTTSVRLAGTNIADKTYYTGMQDGNTAVADQIMVGNKRNLSLSLTHDF